MGGSPGGKVRAGHVTDRTAPVFLAHLPFSHCCVDLKSDPPQTPVVVEGARDAAVSQE